MILFKGRREVSMRACSLFAIAMIWIAGPAGADVVIAGGNDPAVKELVSVAESFLNRLADGDEAGVKALFDGNQANAHFLETRLRMGKAIEALRRTLKERLKDEGPLQQISQSESLKQQAANLPRKVFLINGDVASVSGWVMDRGLRFKKSGGSWKVSHLTGRDRDLYLDKWLRRLTERLEQADADIASGKMTTVEQFKAFVSQQEPGSELVYLKETGRIVTPPRKSDWKAPPVESLVGLIGAERDERLDQLIRSLPGTPFIDAGSNGSVWLYADDAGIIFALSSDGRLMWVRLSDSGADDVAQYRGKLPMDLEFAETRASVEKRLGESDRSSMGLAGLTLSYPERGLDIQFDKADGRNPDIHLCEVVLYSPKRVARKVVKEQRGPRVQFRMVSTTDAGESFSAPPGSPEKSLVLEREVLLTGDHIARVSGVPPREDGRFNTSVVMTDEGARILERVTEGNVGRRMAILFDGEVIMAATIRSKLSKAIIIDLQLSREESVEFIDRLHAAVFRLPKKDE